MTMTMMSERDDDMQGDRSRGRERQSWHSKVKPVILTGENHHDDDDFDEDYDDDDEKKEVYDNDHVTLSTLPIPLSSTP